jgi:hypothetical protein
MGRVNLPYPFIGGNQMIFKGQPNLFVRISNKYIQRVTGKKGFYFDENGRYETENPLLIKLLSQHYEEENNVPGDNPTDIRAMAKEKGIRNWHNMKIENLIAKLKEE